MPVLIDGRPPGLDVAFRAGNPKAVELTWPAGTLTGRTFTATLGVASLAVNVVGDVMTVSATAAQTAAITAAAEFVLTEVLAGDDVETIVGTWTPSDKPAAQQNSTVTVQTDASTVTVSVLANPSTAASNLIDEAVLTSSSSNLNVDAFTLALVPSTVVTVPNVSYSTILRGQGSLIHSVANSVMGLVIVTEGGTLANRVDIGYAYNGTVATNPGTGAPEFLLGPNSPGNYQLAVYSFTTGTVRVDASSAQKAWLRVFSA